MSYMTINRSQYGHRFVSAYHKTHCAFSLAENVISSVHGDH